MIIGKPSEEEEGEEKGEVLAKRARIQLVGRSERLRRLKCEQVWNEALKQLT